MTANQTTIDPIPTIDEINIASAEAVDLTEPAAAGIEGVTDPETEAETAPGLMRVTVFSKNNCPDCTAVKRQFTLKGVPFEEINVQEDHEPRAEFGDITPFEYVVAKYGRQMPVVVVEDDTWGNSWTGSRIDQIVETVGRFRDAEQLIPEDQRKPFKP